MHKSALYITRHPTDKKWKRRKQEIIQSVRSFFRSHTLRIAFFIFLILFSMISFAQDKVEMADTMRTNGKIYVVVAVCLTILIGLFIYLLLIDKKISRYEKYREL